MRTFWLSCLALLVFFAVPVHAQQVNPTTDIRWNAAPGCSVFGSVYSPALKACINGPGSSYVYPAQCAGATRPSWCSGSTADAYYRAACATLPATGGTIDMTGLTGTIAASMVCSTPTKQVITIQDPTSLLTITEADGGIVFPLDNSSMLLGPPGAGQCNLNAGIHLAATANVQAIVGPAHTDGTQEAFTVQGACLWGSTGGVAGVTTQGLVYAKRVFVNTTIAENNLRVCPNSCLWLENMGGQVEVSNNEFSGTDGVYTFNTSPLVIASSGSAGCAATSINIHGGNAEHANGGAGYPEVNITGNDAGAEGCGIYLHDMYVEKNIQGTPSTAAIRIRDCFGCAVTNVQGGGGNSVTGDMLNISQSATGRVQSVTVANLANTFGSWANTINDTTTAGTVIAGAAYPFVSSYISNPGYQQAPALPGSTLQALGADVMAGAGAFSTGSGTMGTGFVASACNAGVVCTYTRTTSSPPPGYTYSQQIAITANADPSSGFNGVQYGTPVSFVAGQTYIANFWGKGDGTFTGFPTFLLWDSTVPTFYCTAGASTPFSTTWTLYSFLCTPGTTGTSNLTIAARTPIGATGTFSLGGFTFAPVTPMTPGYFTSSVSPYGIGTTVKGASISAGTGAPTSTCGTAPTGNGSIWLRTDGAASTSIYSCAAGTWTAVTIP
jgi:hypothetical protein